LSDRLQPVPRAWPPVVVACALMVLAGALYVKTIDYPFVFDDRAAVVENDSIRAPVRLRRLMGHNPTRPLVNLSYALDHARSGLRPRAYHVTNIVLHALNVGLLFMLVRRAALDAARGGGTPLVTATLAAALFAVHPVMTEAVTYISSRSELLSATFLLLGLLAARRALLTHRVRWALMSIVALVLAAGSREIAVVMPAVVFLYDRLLLDGAPEVRRWRVWWIHAPAFALVGCAASVRLWLFLFVEHAGVERLPWMAVPLEVEAVTRYLSLLVVPLSQSIVHDIHPFSDLTSVRALVAAMNLALFLCAAWYLRRSRPLASFGMTWFLLFLLPSAALVVLVPRAQPLAEHRVYLASGGIFVALASAAGLAWERRPHWRVPILVLGLAVTSALAWTTLARNEVWAHSMTLWADAVGRAPRTWIAQYGYAQALQEDGDCVSAVEHYRRAIQLRPGEPKAYYNLALCLAEMGELIQARAAVRQAVLVGRGDAAILRNAARFHAVHGTREELARACQELGARSVTTPECAR
jgi:hypothetical protein